MRTSPTRHPRNKTFQAGFTLAETMIVLVISGLMITLAIPRLDTSKYKADAVAQIVRTTLQNAQRNSITRQHDIIVSFDTTSERIRMIWDANNDGQASPGERVTYYGLENGILFTDPTVRGVTGTAISSSISGSNVTRLDGFPTVTFHRDGSVSSDAEIYISVPARGPKIYRAVTLTQATGRVDWYRLNTTSDKWVAGNM